MQLLTNAIDTESVRHETEDGTDYLVAPVVLVRSMWLNGPDPDGPEVYLPQSEIEDSVDRWDAIPGPIGHPTHNGQPPEQGGRPVSIHDERADASVISEIRNPEPTVSNGEAAVGGELWVDIEAAEQAGSEGQRVVTRLENGDAVEVSSGYAVGEIIAGQFDGEHREAAAVNIQPDHVAILPASKGKCSIADGCGAGAPLAPVANELYVQTVTDGSDEAEDGDGGTSESIADDEPDGSEDDGPVANKTVAGVTFDDTMGGSLDESEIPNDDFESHYLFDGENKSDSSYPVVDAEGNLRRGNVESAFQLGARGGVSGAELHRRLRELNDEFDDPPIDPESLATNALQRAYHALRDVFGGGAAAERDDGDPDRDSDGASSGDEPAESGATTATETSMNDKTKELVENHDFDADNLPDEDTECFGRIYEAVTANADADGGTDADGGDGEGGSDDSGTADADAQPDQQPPAMDVEALVDELEDRFVTTDDIGEAVAEAITANREQERKSDLIDDLVANTDRDRETLESLDVGALEVLAEELPDESSGIPNFAAQRGARPSSTSDPADSFPALSAGERAKELEGGD